MSVVAVGAVYVVWSAGSGGADRGDAAFEPEDAVAAALDGGARTIECDDVAPLGELAALTGRSFDTDPELNSEQPGITRCRFVLAGSGGVLDTEVALFTHAKPSDRRYFTEIVAGTHHRWRDRVEAGVGEWSYARPADSDPTGAKEPHLVIAADDAANVIALVTDHRSAAVDIPIAVAAHVLARIIGDGFPTLTTVTTTRGSLGTCLEAWVSDALAPGSCAAYAAAFGRVADDDTVCRFDQGGDALVATGHGVGCDAMRKRWTRFLEWDGPRRDSGSVDFDDGWECSSAPGVAAEIRMVGSCSSNDGSAALHVFEEAVG